MYGIRAVSIGGRSHATGLTSRHIINKSF
jgi:hypothetical protein